MVTIAKDNTLLTLINIFKVEPDKQQALLEQVQTDANHFVQRFPGMVSVSCHRGLDGKTVATYVQFASQADFKAISNDSELLAHQKRCAELAQSEAHLYTVSSITAKEWWCPNRHDSKSANNGG